jgi:hypothetical protein
MDLADRMARRAGAPDGFVRETFALPREEARAKARAFLEKYPQAAYMSEVESWRELPNGGIESLCAGCGQRTDGGPYHISEFNTPSRLVCLG